MSTNDPSVSTVDPPATGVVQRPLGLAFLALLLAWFALQASNMASGPAFGGEPFLELLIVRTVGLVSGLSAGAACVGLWKVRRWGYHAFLAWAGSVILGGLLASIFTGSRASSSDRLIGLGAAAAVLIPLALYVNHRTDPARAAAYVKRTPYQAGRLQVVFGILLLVPSVYALRWLMTDPNAGYLMIIGALLALAALLGAVGGISLIVGGLWTAYELPGRRWAYAIPLSLGIGLAGYLVN